MLRLASILYSMIATTMAGTGVIVALVATDGTLWPILIGAATGAALAIPVTWLVAKEIMKT